MASPVEQGQGVGMSEQSEHEGPADDGFPAEDVTPEEPDPEMDVTDPFGVGDDREPLGDGQDDGTATASDQKDEDGEDGED